MEFKTNKRDKKNYEESATFISQLFFSWVRPILKEGTKRDLTLNDVYKVREEDKAELLGAECEDAWNSLTAESTGDYAGLNKNGPKTLIGLLISIHGGQFLFYGLLLVILRLTTSTLPAIFLRLLTKSFLPAPPVTDGITDDDAVVWNEDHNQRMQQRYLYAAGLCGTTLFMALCVHCINYQFYHIGVKCSVGLSSLIYRKLLRLSTFGQSQTSIGQIINLISNDVKQFAGVIHFLINFVSTPIQMVIFVYLLWLEIGNACFVGFGFLLLLTPCQYFLSTYSAHFRRKLAKRTDSRARVMSEIINGIRIIKIYVWEKPFSKVIHTLRINEIQEVKGRSLIRAFYVGLFNISSRVTSFITILAIYLMSEANVTADKVFFAISIYSNLCDHLMLIMPEAVAIVSEIMVAAKRIQTFLDLEELQPRETRHMYRSLESVSLCPEKKTVKIENVSAKWTPEKLVLNNISLQVEASKLVIVLGKIGSGKTSLLKIILEELPISDGVLQVVGSLSYISQEPWIFGGTIRQNIVFGAKLDQARYDAVIECCALRLDIEQWPYGDMTIIGEKGITLSGGQKARIGLARAIYHREADVYLFDDPLSAVDSNVSQHIFENCIMKYLKNRTRILVTHQLQYLSQADHIVVLDGGKILIQGSYADIMNSNLDLMEFLNDEPQIRKEKRNRKGNLQNVNVNDDSELINETPSRNESGEPSDEKTAAGSVTWQTYWQYVKSGKSAGTVLLIMLNFLILHGILLFSNMWLAQWTNFVSEESARTATTGSNVEFGASQDRFAWIYGCATLAMAFLFFTTSVIFYRYAMKIGVNLHDQMFSSVVRAPMKFFDQTSSGRIMNRFTKDLSSIDEFLPLTVYELIEVLLKSVSVLIIVMYSTPFMIAPTAIAITLLCWLRNYFVVTSRSLKRIEAISRSPIFTHLSSTFQGLDTIRSLEGQEQVIRQFETQLDTHTSTFLLVAAVNRWFSFWIQNICVAYIWLVTFGVVVITPNASSGNVGLALSAAMTLVFVQWALRQSAETENLMTCVERVFEFVGLKSEAATDTLPEHKLTVPWPSQGTIRFQNVSLSYNEDKSNPVLRNLSFDINSFEKIGIIGRTGAGKSSLITALFRLQEISGGEILIDGVNTLNIGLDELRQSITIIPQDPVLFSGTIRYNLDPFDQFHDSDIWRVLEQVELKVLVGSLDYQVADSGTNFSVGERQLVCLARALLRQNKIIVLDEATANCDVCTDALIQSKLKEYFNDCTTLTIAHRINTIMNSDKILVLDNGSVAEFGSPAELLQDPSSYFSEMVEMAGLNSH